MTDSNASRDKFSKLDIDKIIAYKASRLLLLFFCGVKVYSVFIPTKYPYSTIFCLKVCWGVVSLLGTE